MKREFNLKILMHSKPFNPPNTTKELVRVLNTVIKHLEEEDIDENGICTWSQSGIKGADGKGVGYWVLSSDPRTELEHAAKVVLANWDGPHDYIRSRTEALQRLTIAVGNLED